MQNWLSDLKGHSGPKYLALVDALEQGIRLGTLRPGERLPTQRELAERLNVDLGTVTRAYGIARDAGLIEGAGKLGSFVRNGAGHAAGAASEQSGMIQPPQPGFGLLGEAMRTGLSRLLRAGGGSPLLQYQPPGGSLPDRRQAALVHSERSFATREEQMVLTAGGQNALHAILATLLKPGEGLCVAVSTYPGVLASARALGLGLMPVPCDAGGLDPEAVERAAQAGAKALYVVPTNDNPTTATLDSERRDALAQIARHYGLWIIEDDAYGDLPALRMPPVAVYAPERCWHIGSVSKTISPALRVAHVRVPNGVDATELGRAVQGTAVMAPPINAALVTSWLRDGTFGRLVEGVRQEGVARQRIAARHLAGLDYAAHPEGYHIWLKVGEGVDPAELAATVAPAGLSIVPGEAFAAEAGKRERAVRLSTGGAIDHLHLDQAFAWLAALLQRNKG